MAVWSPYPSCVYWYSGYHAQELTEHQSRRAKEDVEEWYLRCSVKNSLNATNTVVQIRDDGFGEVRGLMIRYRPLNRTKKTCASPTTVPPLIDYYRPQSLVPTVEPDVFVL